MIPDWVDLHIARLCDSSIPFPGSQIGSMCGMLNIPVTNITNRANLANSLVELYEYDRKICSEYYNFPSSIPVDPNYPDCIGIMQTDTTPAEKVRLVEDALELWWNSHPKYSKIHKWFRL